MKLLLLSANTTQSPYPVYPLGLDYIAGTLKPRPFLFNFSGKQ